MKNKPSIIGLLLTLLTFSNVAVAENSKEALLIGTWSCEASIEGNGSITSVSKYSENGDYDIFAQVNMTIGDNSVRFFMYVQMNWSLDGDLIQESELQKSSLMSAQLSGRDAPPELQSQIAQRITENMGDAGSRSQILFVNEEELITRSVHDGSMMTCKRL